MKMPRQRWITRSVVVAAACTISLVVGTAPDRVLASQARSVSATPRACTLLTAADLKSSFGDTFAAGKARSSKRTDSCTWAILPAKPFTEAALILTTFPSQRAATRQLKKVVATKRSDGGRPKAISKIGNAAFFTAPYKSKGGGINVSAIDARVGRVVLKLYYSPQHDPRADAVATLRAHLETLVRMVVQHLH
jgi:hypothetical protein